MDKWQDWVRETIGDDRSRQVGKRIGRSHTTALQWMREPTSPEAVITLARAYNADLLQAFVAAGWLEESDLRMTVDEALRKVASVRLTGELHRRAMQSYERMRSEVYGDVFDEAREAPRASAW